MIMIIIMSTLLGVIFALYGMPVETLIACAILFATSVTLPIEHQLQAKKKNESKSRGSAYYGRPPSLRK